jgi:16S rRNA (cytosine1407-C5)-methyltransferase
MTRRKSRKDSAPKENPLEKSLARYRELLDPREFTLLLEELDKPLNGGLRLNTLKAGVNDLSTWCDRYGWEVEAVPYCSTGFRLLSRNMNPGRTLEHRMGSFYLQDVASMLPAELFDFDPNSHPLILDMAASPGGKTTHLISRTGDLGLVISNDSSRGRIPALRTVLQNWGAVNTAVTCLPGESFGGNFPNTFDAILLDAPCSMDGLRATDAHPLRPITGSERASLARRQTTLLRSALQAVRPGGQVVYSTCTLAPEEDEAVLDLVLGMFPGQVQIDDLSVDRRITAPGLSSDGNRIFHPSVKNAFRLWPHSYQTAGFFAARLKKNDEIPVDRDLTQNVIHSGKIPALLPDSEGKSLSDFFQDQYGIDLSRLMETYQLLLTRLGSRIQLTPDGLNVHFSSLPNLSSGMTLAEETPRGLEISHEFCSRFEKQISCGCIAISDHQKQVWLRGEDIPRDSLSTQAGNRIVILRDQNGDFLGRGRVTSERIKNLLPRRVLL